MSPGELVSRAVAQRYCLNGATTASKLKKLRVASALVEATNRKLSALGGQARPACRSGCAHCCLQLFKVSSLELEVLTFHLLNAPATLEAFVGRYGQRKAREAELQELYDRYTTGTEEEQREVAKRYFEKRVPCALLGPDGACTVYAVRPLVCAGFISSDAESCSRSSTAGYMPPPMRKEYEDAKGRLHAGSRKLDASADLSTMVYRRVVEVAVKGARAVAV